MWDKIAQHDVTSRDTLYVEEGEGGSPATVGGPGSSPGNFFEILQI